MLFQSLCSSKIIAEAPVSTIQQMMNAFHQIQWPRLSACLRAGSPLEAMDAVACGVDFVDASFAVHATRAGQALLLHPLEWVICDMGPSGTEALQLPVPATGIQLEASLQAGAQHASRLHGKQKTPRKRPELTAEAQSALAEAATAAARSDKQRRERPAHECTAGVSSKEAGAAHPDGPAMQSLDEKHQAPTTCTGTADGAALQSPPLPEGQAQPSLQCGISDLVQPGNLGKCHGAHGKRGLAEQAPTHVKHPRHRLDDAQEHSDGVPGASQHTCSAAAGTGSAASRRGASGGASIGAGASGAKQHGAEPAPSTPQLASRIALCMHRQEHRADRRPLSTHCACYTCSRHSRAYVYHLLQTKEILAQVPEPSRDAVCVWEAMQSQIFSETARDSHCPVKASASFRGHEVKLPGNEGALCVQVLLDIHNMHCVCSFFSRIRESLVHDCLPAMRAELASRVLSAI